MGVRAGSTTSTGQSSFPRVSLQTSAGQVVLMDAARVGSMPATTASGGSCLGWVCLGSTVNSACDPADQRKRDARVPEPQRADPGPATAPQ
eukprot:7696288-Pyramimonas_sp.AAC.1